MNIDSIRNELPDDVIKSISLQGIKHFNPLQELVFKNQIPKTNLIVSAPTASGKTLIAEIICLYNIISKNKKAIYVAPMKALVMEKYNEFKKSYPYIKIAVSIGDLDSNDLWLSSFDLIFVSTEKFDSLIRHNIDWIDQIGCIIFDEIHMIDDLTRGATLELLITKLKSRNIQIIGLSATIGNVEDLGKWLDAKIIKSDFRPIELKKGVLFDSKIYFKQNEKGHKLSSKNLNSLLDLVEDHLNNNNQILIFYSTKRNTENEAEKLALFINKKLQKDEKDKLQELSNNILNVLETPTEQCIKISKLVKNGTAFHHSGLLTHQRAYIEDAFKKNLIKVICSTTTLGMGVNLPAHTVLIKNIYRFNNYSSKLLDTNEVLQLLGRAGRPKYDKEGFGLISINAKKDFKKIFENYISAEPLPIYSKLAIAPLLRSHILSFISQDFLNTKQEIEEFISNTFYGFQYNDKAQIKLIIENIIKELNEWGFVEYNGNGENNNHLELDTKLKATKLGKRTSELYIDPLSVKWIVDTFNEIDEINTRIHFNDIDYELLVLYITSNTQELKPYNRMIDDTNFVFRFYGGIGSKFYNDTQINRDNLSNAFTTAMMLKDWISELHDNKIIDKYAITPGFLYSKLSNADWILYSIIEILKILHRPVNKISEIRLRVKYGIKEELLDLVRLQYIGRVRARLLYKNNIKTISDIKANKLKLTSLLGNDLTNKILDQI